MWLERARHKRQQKCTTPAGRILFSIVYARHNAERKTIDIFSRVLRQRASGAAASQRIGGCYTSPRAGPINKGGSASGSARLSPLNRGVQFERLARIKPVIQMRYVD